MTRRQKTRELVIRQKVRRIEIRIGETASDTSRLTFSGLHHMVKKLDSLRRVFGSLLEQVGKSLAVLAVQIFEQASPCLPRSTCRQARPTRRERGSLVNDHFVDVSLCQTFEN